MDKLDFSTRQKLAILFVGVLVLWLVLSLACIESGNADASDDRPTDQPGTPTHEVQLPVVGNGPTTTPQATPRPTMER